MSREDADLIVSDTRAYEADGHPPAVAEKLAVQDALDFSQNAGERVLEQIRASRPEAIAPVEEFWNRQTIRKAGVARPTAIAPVPPAVARPAITPAVPAEVPAAPPAAVAPPPPVVPVPAAPAPIAEAPAPIVLRPESRAVVESAPPEQRTKLERSLAVDTSPDPNPPMAAARKVDPEKNPILAEAMKHGVFNEDSTAQSVMEAIAADKTNPRWLRTIMDLLLKIGAGSNVDIQVVNRPDSNWPALYVNEGPNRPGKILINLAVGNKARGLAQAIAHEATHHVTMMNLRMDDADLTDTQRQAKAELQTIFEDIQARPEFAKDYGRTNLWEFASEVFSNEKLRAKLNAITPEGSRLTLMQMIRRLLARIGFGDQAMRAGSLLEEAMRNTINMASVPAVVSTERAAAVTTAPMAQAHDESYRAVDQQWWKDFAAWREGRFGPPKVFNFGPASNELRAAGFPDGEIILPAHVLDRKPTDPKHPFPVEKLFNLPKKLRDPIMVFQSAQNPDAKTALVEITHEGENFLVAVQFDQRPNKTEISRILSIYPKDSGSVLGWIRDGLATYYHKEKARNWLSLLTPESNAPTVRVQRELTQSRLFQQTAGSNSQRAWFQLQATQNVKTNKDIVKKPPEGPTTAPMAQEVEPEGGFYSGVAKILNRKMPNAAPPQQVKAIIKDAPQEDIKWSGVNQEIDRIAAENKGKVPKEALLQYLRDDGAVRLEEHVMGQAGIEARNRKQELERALAVGLPRKAMAGGMSQLDAANLPWQLQDGRIKVQELPEALQADAQQFLDAWHAWTEEAQKPNIPTPKFDRPDLVLPGGENYREVVLAMPPDENSFSPLEQAVWDQLESERREGQIRPEHIAEYDRLSKKASAQRTQSYTSSHFRDVPNYVAHMRVNDRTDAEGKPGLFLEEIQSDRHQAGREKGYVSEDVTKAFDEAKAAKTRFVKEVLVPKYGETPAPFATEYIQDLYRSKWSPEDAAEFERLNDAVNDAQEKQGAVPDAPFRKDWPLQMFKRALRDAVDTGKSWIGWTTGETQAERYDQSKQISEVHYSGTNLKAYDHDGNTVIEQTGVSREQLADYIGKEAATKLLEQPAQGTLRSLTGQDLKVGGEGMKGFYDKILPNEIGKYVKQWGGKVEQSGIDISEGKSLTGFEKYPEGVAPIWKVGITPQMKETITAKGQALFGAVAPMAQKPVQDGTDVIAAPLSLQGRLTRFFAGGEVSPGYRTGGIFRAAGGFNQQIWQTLRTKTQNGKALVSRAQWVIKDLQRAIKAAYGKAGPNDTEERDINMALGTTDNRLTPVQAEEAKQIRDEKVRAEFIEAADQANIAAYRIQQQEALARLPEAVRERIVEMRDLVDQMSVAVIKFGGISPDLRATIEKNRGIYLHRSYQIFEDHEGWKKRLESETPEAKRILSNAKTLFETYVRAQKAIDHATMQRDAGTPITRAAAKEYAKDLDVAQGVQNMLDDYLAKGEEDSNINLMGGRLPGKQGTAIMTVRGQIPQEVRELWGEFKDPAINFYKSYVSIGTYIENHRFQNQVLEDGLTGGYLWKKGVSTGERPIGFKQIAGEAKSMGPLADVWGPPELAKAMEAYNSRAIQGGLARIASGFIAIPLAAKTVGSVGSIVRNFFGNVLLVLANGNAFFGSLTGAAKTTLADAVQKGPDAVRDYIQKLNKLGVLGENVGPEMLRELIESANFDQLVQEGWAKKAVDVTKKIAKPVGDVFQKAYSGVDNVWKIYSYEAELAKLKWAYENDPNAPSEAELEKQAADIVRATMPTFSEAWSLMRAAGPVKKYIAPFIMFKTEVMRVTVGSTLQAYKEVRSSNGRMQALGYLRFGGLMAAGSMPFIVSWVTRAIFHYDEDDEDAIRESLPDYQKNAMLVFAPPDEKGNPTFYDISYMNPYSVFTAPVMATMRAFKDQKDPTGAVLGSAGAAGLWELAKPFTTEQLGVAMLIDIERNQDSSRNFQPLYNKQDTTANKVAAVAGKIYHTFSPGTLDSIERIWRASRMGEGGVRGEVTPSGRRYELSNEIMSPLLGTKKLTYQRQQALQFLTARFEGDKREAENLFTRSFNNRGTVSPGDVAAGYQQANARRKDLYYQMRQNYLGHVALGLTTAQAKQAMIIGSGQTMESKNGLSEKDLKNIIAGKYTRYEPSQTSINVQKKLHPERYQEYIAARNAAPASESIAD